MPCHILQKAQEPLQAAAEAVGLRLRPLDKKAEKTLAQAQQDDLTAQLADQSDPAAVLSLVVPLLVMQVRNYPVHASAACDCDARCQPPPQRSSVLHTQPLALSKERWRHSAMQRSQIGDPSVIAKGVCVHAALKDSLLQD